VRQPPKKFPKRSLRFYDLEQRRHADLDAVVVDVDVAHRLTRYLIDTLGLWQPVVAFHPRSRMHWWEEHESDTINGYVIVYAEQGILVTPGIRLTDIAHEVAHHWQHIEAGDTKHNAELATLVDWTVAIIADLVVQSPAKRKKS